MNDKWGSPNEIICFVICFLNSLLLNLLIKRTWRMGVFETFYNMGVPIAFGVGGALVSFRSSEITSLYISMGFSLLSLLIVLIGIEGGLPSPTKKREECQNSPIAEKTGSLLPGLIRTLFKKRQGNLRGQIWALLVAYAFIVGPFNGL
jgi:hypothetical protein